MKIENLTPQQVEYVESLLGTMKLANPHLLWETYAMGAEPHPIHHEDPRNPKGATDINEADVALFLGEDYLTPVEERLKRVEDKVDTLLTRLDLIFGDQVLLQGRFVNIKDMHHG
jgi:hypothetical protein